MLVIMRFPGDARLQCKGKRYSYISHGIRNSQRVGADESGPGKQNKRDENHFKTTKSEVFYFDRLGEARGMLDQCFEKQRN